MIQGFYKELLSSLKSFPDALAYTCYGKTLTYEELYDITARICSYLAGRNKKNIYLYSEKSIYAYGAIYAILFTNNTWIPLPTDIPQERMENLLAITAGDLILTDIDVTPEIFEYAKENNIGIVSLQDIVSKHEFVEVELGEFSPDDVAYIMFTSGSTGIPKGVPMTHANYIPFVRNTLDILDIKQFQVFSDYHDYAFDISIFYLFCCPLRNGAFAPITKKEDKIIPYNFIISHNVSVWSSVPSVVSRIEAFLGEKALNCPIKIAFLCGEPFSLKVLKYCYDILNIPEVYNFYGLTETAVENFWHKCSSADIELYEPYGFVPIGLPLPGNDVLLTEDHELLLKGVQITTGYLGGVGSEKFCEIAGDTWFKTGDVVELKEDVYFCKGRMDSQVKLSGYRVELMDIEVNMRRYSGVREAVCIVSEKRGRKVLVGFVQLESENRIDFTAFRSFLVSVLPPYMIPAKIEVVTEFPCNQNGKLDRKKIKEQYEQN